MPILTVSEEEERDSLIEELRDQIVDRNCKIARLENELAHMARNVEDAAVALRSVIATIKRLTG